MKKILLWVVFLICVTTLQSQNCYWVFFSDKNGTSFNPYQYFDAKAIERYQLNGADLYDISNYPVNDTYVSRVNALATEEVGTSRWLNAIAVMATPQQAMEIASLAFVAKVQQINSEAMLASYNTTSESIIEQSNITNTPEITLSDQLIRQQGGQFRQQGINGRGVRVAVFDGGFPKVNTHNAFSHLRNEGRILKTWNFPNRKEDVYGWSTHGTMVLSCIAGIRDDGTQLGLATGAEFLLARTEVNAEPFKEEVWWMQAVEWADKNGAQVINSSLGYGKDRYYTRDMNGTSYVAKAANMAARKGILVCNSAGNEGDDRSWKTIITPADADSVICVGGIENNLHRYRHISFSSFGPTADGRLKPDVVNFGYANVANPKANDSYTWVYGTSFASPLTAGFVACAMQAHPGRTAMQMKQEIIESCDLYPYADYAYGHGVPQASYFTSGKTQVSPTFSVEYDSLAIFIHPIGNVSGMTFFINAENPDGSLERYTSIEIASPVAEKQIAIHKACLVNRKLNINANGYYQQVTLTPQDNNRLLAESQIEKFDFAVIDTDGFNDWSYHKSIDRNFASNRVREGRVKAKFYVSLGSAVKTSSIEESVKLWSPASRIGIGFLKPITKGYGLGLNVEYGFTKYNIDATTTFALDTIFTNHTSGLAVNAKNLKRHQFGLELFQRVRMLPAGMVHNGVFWDLGLYGRLCSYSYNVDYKLSATTIEGNFRAKPTDVDGLHRIEWGLATRICYDFVGVTASYRMNGLFSNGEDVTMPRLEFGLIINF